MLPLPPKRPDPKTLNIIWFVFWSLMLGLFSFALYYIWTFEDPSMEDCILICQLASTLELDHQNRGMIFPWCFNEIRGPLYLRHYHPQTELFTYRWERLSQEQLEQLATLYSNADRVFHIYNAQVQAPKAHKVK